jgi:hypothetical protein
VLINGPSPSRANDQRQRWRGTRVAADQRPMWARKSRAFIGTLLTASDRDGGSCPQIEAGFHRSTTGEVATDATSIRLETGSVRAEDGSGEGSQRGAESDASDEEPTAPSDMHDGEHHWQGKSITQCMPPGSFSSGYRGYCRSPSC